MAGTTGQKGRAKSAEERERIGAAQRAAWARRRELDAGAGQLHDDQGGKRLPSGPPVPVLGAYGARLARRAVGLFGAPVDADEGGEGETGDAA